MSENRDAQLAVIGAALIETLDKVGMADVDIALLGVAVAGCMLGRCPADEVKRNRKNLLRIMDANEAHTRRLNDAYERAGPAGLSPQEGWA